MIDGDVRAGHTPAEKSALYDTMDDSTSGHPERALDAFEQFCKVIPGGGYDAAAGNGGLVQGKGGYDYHWTGIIGLVGVNSNSLGTRLMICG